MVALSTARGQRRTRFGGAKRSKRIDVGTGIRTSPSGLLGGRSFGSGSIRIPLWPPIASRRLSRGECMSEGTARIVDRAVVEMVTDGPCLAGTLEQLEAGVGAKPMPGDALAKVRTDALALLAKVLEAYVTDVATTEVGLGGSALASDTSSTSGRSPTGLLYGRVQSGKTVAMITFCAAAIDNGFRVI